MSACAVAAVSLVAAFKVGMFVVAVRGALRPQVARPIDPDGPDGSWRWWEEFGPEPEPPAPGGERRELVRS